MKQDWLYSPPERAGAPQRTHPGPFRRHLVRCREWDLQCRALIPSQRGEAQEDGSQRRRLPPG
jgi:hypothetical protein